MSAIYGLWGEASLGELAAMGDRLAYRGSQVLEWSPYPGVFLGYRGFGDLPEEAQLDQAGPLVASGSLYNKDELLEKIRQSEGEPGSGHSFEIIGAAYRTLGPGCFGQINGDFATAIWDETGKKLILARDKLGCRIIYYWSSPGRFAFASEYKAFLALRDFFPEPDLPSIQYFQASKYLLPGKTLLRSVCSIPSAHWLEVSKNGLQLQRYWSVEIKPNQVSIPEASATLRRYFLRSVERRLEGVDLLQAELSGGIDSAAVVAAIEQIRPGENIHTYTIGTGPEDAEVLSARRIAEQFNTVHQEIYSDPHELIEYLPQMVFHIEDPVGRTESFLYYRLMEVAQKNGTVVFGGTVSDSLFAGMPRHKILRLIELFPLMKKPLEEFYHYVYLSEPPRTQMGKALQMLYFGRGEKLAPVVRGIPENYAPSSLSNHNGSYLNQALVAGVENGVPNSMAKVEKTHMAHGVEFRSPFTDIDLVNYAFSLPENYKIRRFKEKYILRQALLPLLPKEIANRAKYPQRMDYDHALSEVLDEMADCLLGRNAVQSRGFFNPAEIDSLRNRPPGKPYNSIRAMRLWTVIVTELWARIFLDERGRRPAFKFC